MDKSNHIDAGDLAEMVIAALIAAKIEDEDDSYFLEGMNEGLKTAIQKVEEICKREDVPIFVPGRK